MNNDYFTINHTNTELEFIFSPLIHDIIFEDSNYIIPYRTTHTQYYKIYQDLTFKIIDKLNLISTNGYLNIFIKFSISSIPSIIITNFHENDYNIIQNIVSQQITTYINNVFSIFV
jgi:hypothetical protein